jgi:hypothetical protein
MANQSNKHQSKKNKSKHNTPKTEPKQKQPTPTETNETTLKWRPYELDYRAQKLVLKYRDQDVLNESHKMRTTVTYGLERFWGEHLRLKKENSPQEKAKGEYWEAVWQELANILKQGEISLPNDSISLQNGNNEQQTTEEIQNFVDKIWGMELEDRRIALMILTQLCDSLVWWTQRYKKKK